MLKRDDGTSLIEMVVVTALLLVVVGAVLSSLDSGVATEARHRARSETLDGLRGAMSRMTKDIRQATAVGAMSSATRLEIQTFDANGSSVAVVYDVSGTTLRRTIGAGAPVALLGELSGTGTIFTYDTAPSAGTPAEIVVKIASRPEAPGSTPIALDSSVTLRNTVSP